MPKTHHYERKNDECHVTLEKLLKDEEVNWDRVSSYIKCSRKSQHQQQQKHYSDSLILLAVIKKKKVPLPIVQRLIEPCTKLKTLRNAFDCACANNQVGDGVTEFLLNEMNPSPSLAETLLLIAAKSNNEQVIEAIIHRKALFLSPSFYHNTFYKEEDFEMLSEILIQRHLEHKDLMYHARILHAAAYRGHVALVNAVVNAFPGTLSLMDHEGNLPLHCACESCEWVVARILLSKGLGQFSEGSVGGLFAKNKHKKSALQIAIGSGSDGDRIRQVVEWLYLVDESKILYSVRVMKDQGLFHQISRHGICLSLLDNIFREHPNCMHWKDHFGKTPLMVACENGKFDTAEKMVHTFQSCKGKKLEFPFSILKDAVIGALEPGINPDDVAQFMIKIDIPHSQLLSSEDVLLLHHVAGKGSVACMKELLHNCPTSVCTNQDSNGSLPIHWACHELNLDMIKYLLREHISYIDYGGMLQNNHHGLTPLKYLLDAFFDPEADLLLTSNCIKGCLEVIDDLPLIHFAISELNLDADMIQELLEHFENTNISSIWRDRTALVHLIDKIAHYPSGTESQRLLDVFSKNSVLYHNCLAVKVIFDRLPLHYAVALGLRWNDGINKLVEGNYYSLAEKDGKTGLLPFMLSAVGSRHDLDTIFNLLRSNPSF